MIYVWAYLGGEEQHVQEMHSIRLETQSKGGRVFWDIYWKSCGNWKYIDGLRVMLIEFKASGKGPLFRHALELVADEPVKEFHLLANRRQDLCLEGAVAGEQHGPPKQWLQNRYAAVRTVRASTVSQSSTTISAGSPRATSII